MGRIRRTYSEARPPRRLKLKKKLFKRAAASEVTRARKTGTATTPTEYHYWR